MLKKNASMSSSQHATLALRVSVCLTGAPVMLTGEPISAENHTGIAAAIGIAEISLIARSSKKGERVTF